MIFIYGIGIPVVIYTAIIQLLFKFIIPTQNLYLLFSIALPIIAYLILSWIAIWNCSKKHSGLKINSYLAKGVVLINLSIVVYLGYTLCFVSKIMGTDEGKNSYNISEYLNYANDLPFVGFWKKKCSDDHGLAINRIAEGRYPVVFCGPGGCFKSGAYRPNTSLINDSDYKIINKNLIEVKGNNGFSKYVRCR